MSEKLKPCPFCGSNQIEILPGRMGYWTCRCKVCEAVSGWQYGLKRAVNLWNRRVGESAKGEKR